ncbi:MAG: DUF86 domain-containing protein [Phycisphaerae bacterium]
MSKPLRDGEYLTHICDAVERIHRYTAGKSEVDFMADELLRDGVIRNLEIIGEAVGRISPELKSRHEDIPWREISGMRNRLIHGYMDVNFEMVWDTVATILPDFLSRIKNIQKTSL